MRLKFAVVACVLFGLSCMRIARVQAQESQVTRSSEVAAPAQQAQAPTPQGPLHVDGDTMNKKLVYVVSPVYPQIAVMAHVSGTIVMDAIINGDGTVRALRFISGPALLRQTGTVAAKQWRYEPTLLNGQPVEVETTVSVRFDLYDAVPFTFTGEVREPGSSRTMLKETIEVPGIGKKQDWTNFIAAFGNVTSGAWLAAIPASAGDKEGKVAVSFVLGGDGTLNGGVPLMHSSDDSIIDSAARLAIQDSAPFRNVPSDLPEPSFSVRVGFAYDHPHAVAAPAGAAQ